MDCNTGMQLGQQLQKDAMLMHGGVRVDKGMNEQDALMQAQIVANPVHMAQPMNFVNPAEWAQSFASQQQQQQQQQQQLMQHGMQTLQQQQPAQANLPQMQNAAPILSQPIANIPPAQAMMMNNQMMMGNIMATTNLNVGMMLPRTQYQSTLNLEQEMQKLPALTSVNEFNQDNAWSSQLGNQQWGQDYTNVQTFNVEGVQEATVEEKTKNSEFYAFMDRIRNRELLIDEEKGEIVAGPGPDPEVAEDTEELRRWAEAEGLNMPESVFQPHVTTNRTDAPTTEAPIIEDYHDDNELAGENMDEWVREYNEMQKNYRDVANRTDYPFEPNNHYIEHENPFQEGMDMLQLSNLAEAALAFEAACQQNNDYFESWYQLGKAQAENEKDGLAIIALNNARRLQPNNIAVHADLCVAHTNEHNTDAAMASLRAWLIHNPEYEVLSKLEIAPETEVEGDEDTFYYADPTQMREISTLYHAAIEMNPGDVQLYINLGVLNNISHDYDEAVTCFRKAVELRPDDAMLWNKLGATLANANKPEEALGMYNRALELNPTLVRTMYNVAVSLSNLGRYMHAAKQLIRAIALQEGGTNPTGEGAMIAARGMWELLRMTLSLMNREDLVGLTNAQQIGPLIKEFGLEELV